MSTGWHLQQIIIFEKCRNLHFKCLLSRTGGMQSICLLSKITFEIKFSGNAYPAEGSNNFGTDYTYK